MLAAEDKAGQAWCREHGYRGYTSYASLSDLPRRASVFGDLKRRLDRHAARFAADLAFDLGPRGRLKLDSLWVNVLKSGGAHSGHIHPHSVLSGTVYVAAPPGGRANLSAELCHPDPSGGHALHVGKLAAPRGAARPRQDAARKPEFQ